jgi:nucleotide-binding universal stress UspA family protein
MALDLMRHAPRAKCQVLHVYRHEGRFAGSEEDQVSRKALAGKYDAFMAGIDTHGIAVEPIFEESHRVDLAIARQAQKQGADLIITSSRGRTFASGFVQPSITEQAIRQSRTAFLVLKAAEKPVGLWQAIRERWHKHDDLQFS